MIIFFLILAAISIVSLIFLFISVACELSGLGNPKMMKRFAISFFISTGLIMLLSILC